MGLQRDSGSYSEFLGPLRVGASVNLGAFFVKLRLKPLPFGLAARPQRIRCLSDLSFHKCRGEIRWIVSGDPSQLHASLGLPLSAGTPANYRHYAWNGEKKSVAPITHARDGNQGAAPRGDRNLQEKAGQCLRTPGGH